jgi:sterol desaturase/sphingolipid hydroxylase (fatty acid hydroxylase superfamily)
VLAALVLQLEPFFRTLEARGKPLDVLTNIDWAFIIFNKLSTSVFTYHLLRYCAISGKVVWSMDQLDWTLLPQVALLFVVYDLFYTLFHMGLHQRGVYKHVHKVSPPPHPSSQPPYPLNYQT